MRTFNPELDHIDPQWKEGRDYQLVCGREEPCNLIYRDARFNTAKSNRFLPWRVAADEIGTVPVEQGDLCLFLVGANIEQDVPGEWVLMEFLSEEWFAATQQTAGGVRALEEWRSTIPPSAMVQRQWEFYEQNPDKLRERNEKIKQWSQDFVSNPQNLKKRGESIRRAKKRRFKCLQTGYVGNGSAVSQYQIKHGIDHKDPANRIRLE